jgi:hypothetical protein
MEALRDIRDANDCPCSLHRALLAANLAHAPAACDEQREREREACQHGLLVDGVRVASEDALNIFRWKLASMVRNEGAGRGFGVRRVCVGKNREPRRSPRTAASGRGRIRLARAKIAGL